MIEILTDRENVILKQMSLEEDNLAWCLAKRTEPSVYLPNQPEAPDNTSFEFLTISRQIFPNSIDLGLWEYNDIKALVSIYPDESDQTAEISYCVAPQHRRLGFGAIAVKAATLYASNQMNISSIYAEIEPDNTASQRLIKRAGFLLINAQTNTLIFNYDTKLQTLV